MIETIETIEIKSATLDFNRFNFTQLPGRERRGGLKKV